MFRSLNTEQRRDTVWLLNVINVNNAEAVTVQFKVSQKKQKAIKPIKKTNTEGDELPHTQVMGLH